MNGREPFSGAMRKMLQLQSAYFTKESIGRGMSFQPSPTDVIISTTPKSGTTWVQQICHGLRSRGDMSFKEICLVVPCLEMAHDAGIEDLQQPQPYTPRMFKTHFPYDICPKGAGKYIVVIRRPSDAALSLYHFLGDWFFPKEEIAIEDFTIHNFLARGGNHQLKNKTSHYNHILSWYPHRLDKNVLWLHYEDLKENLAECVRLISEFLEIGNDDEELQKLARDQASFEFMAKHAHQFDDHPVKHNRNVALGLPRDAGLKNGGGKVRNGKTDASKSVLSPHLLALVQEKWTKVVTPKTGYEDYDSLRRGINKELQRSFS